MDTEKTAEVLDASETLQQEETEMEKEVVSKLETPEEFTEPEKPPAADEETEQLAVNGHDSEVVNLKETEELIVAENVTPAEEKREMEIEDSLPGEKSEMESVPVAVAPPERDESSEKISDPVAAADTEPENMQPVPENDPEPLPVQTPLAESAPEPEPETLAQPEPQEQTLPEPTALQQPVDTQPPSQEEKVSEQVKTETGFQTTMNTGIEEFAKEETTEDDVAAEPTKEGEDEKAADAEKPAETVLVAEVSPEKPTETVTVKVETPAEIESVKPADDEKEAEPEKSDSLKEAEPEKSDSLKEAEPEKSDSLKEAEPEKSESLKEAEPEKSDSLKEAEPEKSDSLKEAEPEKSDSLKEAEAAAAESVKSEEVDTLPASGSLSFSLLEREQTKDALRTSRTLVVLRGLPASGKTFLARAIADAYKDHCSVVCADDHGVKPESPESSVEGYKALDEAVVARCSAGTASSVLLVVDDTNHTQDRLARLGEIAEQHHLVALFLEPRTEWRRDPAQLAKKNRRGLQEAQLEAMRGPLEETTLPLFFGWFLLSSIKEKVRCTSMDFLKTLDTLEAFKKHMIDFTGKAEKEVDLEQYFQAKGILHCTTKFCDYGKAEGAKEYAQNPAVQDFYGSASELSLSALFVTPRTVGARVSLTEEQLLLWPADAEKEAGSASLPLGSRAHVTLGCAEGVEPVQTGLDLLEILAMQQDGQQGELIEEMELGSLTYYGEGRWLLSLREPICSPACFSSFYGRKELPPTKKEPEKKKKQKCTIL